MQLTALNVAHKNIKKALELLSKVYEANEGLRDQKFEELLKFLANDADTTIECLKLKVYQEQKLWKKN